MPFNYPNMDMLMSVVDNCDRTYRGGPLSSMFNLHNAIRHVNNYDELYAVDMNGRLILGERSWMYHHNYDCRDLVIGGAAKAYNYVKARTIYEGRGKLMVCRMEFSLNDHNRQATSRMLGFINRDGFEFNRHVEIIFEHDKVVMYFNPSIMSFAAIHAVSGILQRAYMIFPLIPADTPEEGIEAEIYKAVMENGPAMFPRENTHSAEICLATCFFTYVALRGGMNRGVGQDCSSPVMHLQNYIGKYMCFLKPFIRLFNYTHEEKIQHLQFFSVASEIRFYANSTTTLWDVFRVLTTKIIQEKEGNQTW